MPEAPKNALMSKRFRGFLPVVVDVETGGFNAKKDALLEIGALTLKIDQDGHLEIDDTFACHVEPFPNANMDPKSLEVNGIDPFHPFRMANQRGGPQLSRESFSSMPPQSLPR